MECAECSRLIAAHERLKGDSAVAKHQLQEGAIRWLLPPVEYQALLATANEAWMDAECARLELERHKHTHGSNTVRE